ncbi:hypothetical protein HX109_05415 [Galbibacter sp. BG1]|uniref:hypothetical protein n=1 Tax=Galbibacter sp. BG1 TaxID=1170699 RepID=UPI0015BD4931|nr:hypothetical protein [Galbibacter sp. BG1]QLE01030.1 hypothetical protein HX109_05415 [Galbibacter sp. BG1]
MEMIKFEGKEYPTLLLSFPFGERQVSTEKLNDSLMNVDGTYVSEDARIIDEEIFYFTADENLLLKNDKLVELILSEI